LAPPQLSSIFQLNILIQLKRNAALLLVLTGFVSCRSTWNQTKEQTFYNACLDDAKTWAASPEQAVTYCNCVISKIKQKYPNEQDALKQIDSLVLDKDLQACKESLNK
jgi:hypothetical protein